MKSDDTTERAKADEKALWEIRQREENEIEAKIEELRKHRPSSLRDKDDKENRLKKLKKELDELRCKPLAYFLEPSRKRCIEKIRKILHQIPDSPGRGPEDTDRPLEEYSDQELVSLEIMIKSFRLDDGKGTLDEVAVENAKRKDDLLRELLRDEIKKLGTTDRQTDKRTSLSHTERAVRTIQAKYFYERWTFETFAKKYLKNKKPPPTKAETIHAAKEKHPTLSEVPDKRMREWLGEIFSTIV